MSDTRQPPKEFQPIEDSTEADHLLKESAKSLASVMIWTKDQGYVIRTNVSRYSPSDSVYGTDFPKDLDLRAFQEALRSSGTDECYFSVSLTWANIFFKTRFIGSEPGGLRFLIPGRLFKVQRRRELRYRIPEGQSLKVNFNDPATPGTTIEKSIYDISASGLAFLVTPEEADAYPSDLAIKNISLVVSGRTISAEGRVRHTKTIKIHGKPALGVGLAFTAIRPGDSQRIASYVFEESRKYFLRFI